MDRDDWNERYRTAELVWTAEPNRYVVAEVADLAPGRVIDVAAGEGRNAVWLAERGWTASAVDYSDVALAKAVRLAEARSVVVDTVVADVTTWVPEPASADLVLVAYLQLPVPQRATAFGRAAAALAEGGTFLVVAHDRANLDGGHGGPQDPDVLATAAETARLLTDLGLDVVKAEIEERPVETPAGPRIALDHVVRAVRTGNAGADARD